MSLDPSLAFPLQKRWRVASAGRKPGNKFLPGALDAVSGESTAKTATETGMRVKRSEANCSKMSYFQRRRISGMSPSRTRASHFRPRGGACYKGAGRYEGAKL